MRRFGYFALFSALALVAGPFVYLISTVVVLNAIRGLILLLINFFDYNDFSFLPNLIVAALSIGAVWLLLRGGVWLWCRVLPDDSTSRQNFQRTSMIAVLVTLALSIGFAVVVSIFLVAAAQDSAFFFDSVMEVGLGPYALLLWAGALYMPLSWVAFQIGYQTLDDSFSGDIGLSRLSAACVVLPPLILISYVILQWINGNIF